MISQDHFRSEEMDVVETQVNQAGQTYIDRDLAGEVIRLAYEPVASDSEIGEGSQIEPIEPRLPPEMFDLTDQCREVLIEHGVGEITPITGSESPFTLQADLEHTSDESRLFPHPDAGTPERSQIVVRPVTDSDTSVDILRYLRTAMSQDAMVIFVIPDTISKDRLCTVVDSLYAIKPNSGLDYGSISPFRGWTRDEEPIFYSTEPAGDSLYFEHPISDIDPEWIQREDEIIAVDMSTNTRDPLIAFDPNTWRVEPRTVDITDEKSDQQGTTNLRIHIPFVPDVEFDTSPTSADFSILLCPTAANRAHSNPVLYVKGERKQTNQR